MTNEEKKAIEEVKRLLNFNINNPFLNEEEDAIRTILDVIEKQNKEIEKKDRVIDKMAEDIIEYEQDLKYEELYKDTEEVIEYYKKVVEDK